MLHFPGTNKRTKRRSDSRAPVLILSAFVFTIATFAGISLRAEDSSFVPPVIAKRGADASAFVPKNWKILKSATGDLNRDKKPDLVLVLTPADDGDDPSSDRWQTPRLMIVLLKEGAGYKRAAYSAKAVLCRGCGGVFGEPFESLKIERGTFVFSHYAGSRLRWGFTHRFRLQNGDFYLIGRTTVNHDTATHKYESVDENLLTGDVIEKHVSEQGKKKHKKYRKKRAPLISFARFSNIN